LEDIHVRLRVGGEVYALPIAHVVEVMEVGNVATVPGAGPGLLGITNLRGQVLPVFDLAQVLGLGRDQPPQRIVVAANRDELVGLAVDEVTDVGVLGSESEETDVEHLRCAVLDGGSLIGVVDVERMFGILAAGAIS
jgi:purine-binding chemotaxis protein CheW